MLRCLANNALSYVRSFRRRIRHFRQGLVLKLYIKCYPQVWEAQTTQTREAAAGRLAQKARLQVWIDGQPMVDGRLNEILLGMVYTETDINIPDLTMLYGEKHGDTHVRISIPHGTHGSV